MPENKPSPFKDQLQCACQLCSCGRHHCAVRLKPITYQTSYQAQYLPDQAQYLPNKIQNLPRQYSNSTADRYYPPRRLLTDYQQNYNDKSRIKTTSSQMNAKLANIGVHKSIIKQQIPFYGESSYAKSYQTYNIQAACLNPELPTKLPTQNNVKTYKIPFQGTTSYSQQFTPPPQQKHYFPSQKQNNFHQVLHIPLHGSSSYKDAYQPYTFSLQPTISNSKSSHAAMTPMKFNGCSAYQDEFRGYRIMTCNKSVCPVQKLNVPGLNEMKNGEHLYYDEKEGKFY